MPASAIAPPTGWFHVSDSPRTAIPSAVENSGMRYVTLVAVVAPARRTIAKLRT